MSKCVAALFGGVNLWHSTAPLRKGVEFVVSTPNRFLDAISHGYTNTNRVTFLVIDEADRM